MKKIYFIFSKISDSLEYLDIIQSYRKYMRKNYAGVNPDWESTCYEMFATDRAKEEIDIIYKVTDMRFREKRLLEIGSGNGVFLAITEKEGISSYGIEPDMISIKTSIAFFKKFDVKTPTVLCAVGENLPFRSGVFDIICSFYVLEHCASPQQVLQESIRVLRKGGYIVFIIPNYGSIYEGHYKIPWIPYMPKFLARIWVSFFKRQSSFLDSLNFLNAFSIEKLVQSNEKITVRDMGYELWRERLLSNDLGTWSKSTPFLKKISDLIHKLRLVRLVCLLGRLFKFYTPIILVIQKN